MRSLLSAIAAYAAAASAACAATVFDFTGPDGFDVTNYRDKLSIEWRECMGESAVVIERKEKKGDCYWGVMTPKFPVKAGRTFAVKVRAKSDISLLNTRPMSAVHWFKADGGKLLAQDVLGRDSPVTTFIQVRTSPSGYRETLKTGVVPDGAAFAAVRICADSPDLGAGQSAAISRVEFHEREEGKPWGFGDVEPPKIERITKSPNADFNAAVSFRISDPSGVGKVAVSLDGTDVTHRISFAGDVATFTPSAPWGEDSIHEFRFTVEDRRGNEGTESRFMCFTRGKVAHEKVTVRDDGVVLCDGKPFFPISIYSVCPQPIHRNDVNCSVKALKEAGFNVLATYSRAGSAEWCKLVDACDREGLKVWTEAGPRKGPARDPWIRREILAGRSRRTILGWCIGDDTSTTRTIDAFARDFELIRAVDPDALVMHVDGSSSRGTLANFAPWTDLFCSELYPLRTAKPQADELPKIQTNMEIAYGDLKSGGSPTPSVVAVLQSFSGYQLWQRYPTFEELRAMTFLALACRSRGMKYYTYSTGPNGDGAAATHGRFAELSRITREVSALAPQLVTRDAAVQPEVRIVEGPQKASLNLPSVTALLKESGLLIAVNIATEPVKAVLSMPDGRRREVSLGRNGVFVGQLAK